MPGYTLPVRHAGYTPVLGGMLGIHQSWEACWVCTTSYHGGYVLHPTTRVYTPLHTPGIHQHPTVRPCYTAAPRSRHGAQRRSPGLS